MRCHPSRCLRRCLQPSVVDAAAAVAEAASDAGTVRIDVSAEADFYAALVPFLPGSRRFPERSPANGERWLVRWNASRRDAKTRRPEKWSPEGGRLLVCRRRRLGTRRRGERFMRSAEFPRCWVASFASRSQHSVIDWWVFGADIAAGARRHRNKRATVCLNVGGGIELGSMAVRSPTKAAAKPTRPLFLTLLIRENLSPPELVDLWEADVPRPVSPNHCDERI